MEGDFFIDKILNELKPILSVESNAVLCNIAKKSDNYEILKLHFTPRSEIFTKKEEAILSYVDSYEDLSEDLLPRHPILILKATRLCNLRCSYCNSWREGPDQIMKLDILSKVIRETLAGKNVRSVDFVWHGGEITTLKPSFLKKAIWLQEYYNDNQIEIHNSIQTNAVNLTDKWIETLRNYKINVGVSIDGPPEIHDTRRITKAGKGTHKDVLSGINKLKEANIKFGALAVIDECVIDYGAENYLQYLTNLGLSSVALLNVLPANDSNSPNLTSYLNWERYQSFMITLFKCWWTKYQSKILVRELQSLVDSIKNGGTGLCLYSTNCMGHYLTIEPTGEVSACDKYVGNRNYFFGSLQTDQLNTILKAANLIKAKNHVDKIKLSTKKCKYYKYCKGGCPHDFDNNIKNLGTWNEECCGLTMLLEEMVSTISQQFKN